MTPPRILADRHVRLSFEGPDGIGRFSGVAWGRRTSRAEQSRQQNWAPGDSFDIAYHLRRNWHPDFGGWELEIIALERLS
jgi:single-stranded-DNA-specific exonuclease